MFFDNYIKQLHEQNENDESTFTIKCTMKNRWIPHFIGMLRGIEYNGKVGHSGKVGIYADGDGDFRPQFDISLDIKAAKPIKDNNDEVLYDAG